MLKEEGHRLQIPLNSRLQSLIINLIHVANTWKKSAQNKPKLTKVGVPFELLERVFKILVSLERPDV